MASLPTALDNLLENKLSFENEAGNLDMGLNLAGGGKLENERPEHGYKKSGVSSLDMLLKPGAKERSKCEVLRVTDFVNKLVQKEEDKILVDSQGTNPYIKGVYKKPSLEALTVPQWVIGSIRIFYHLLEGNKFQDRDDMLSYMGHMVKVMELAERYEWLSVVKFDDEFRHIQALYNYPWLYESHHLHATLLRAKTPASFPVTAEHKSKKQPSGQSLGTKVAPALYTVDGRVICERYNGQYGCQLVACNCVHVCNRNAGGQACGLPHPSVQHGISNSTSPATNGSAKHSPLS